MDIGEPSKLGAQSERNYQDERPQRCHVLGPTFGRLQGTLLWTGQVPADKRCQGRSRRLCSATPSSHTTAHSGTG